MLEARGSTLEARNMLNTRNLKFRNQKQVIRSHKLEDRSLKPGSYKLLMKPEVKQRNKKLDIGTHKSEVRNQKLKVRSKSLEFRHKWVKARSLHNKLQTINKLKS